MCSLMMSVNSKGEHGGDGGGSNAGGRAHRPDVVCISHTFTDSIQPANFTSGSTLTFAAMDTTSNALSLTLWRLAQNPQVQAKLRQEILDAQEAHDGANIGYDDLVALPYLDAVCRETLRM